MFTKTQTTLFKIIAVSLTAMLIFIATDGKADDRPPITEYHFNELTDKDVYLIEKQRERTRSQAKWTGKPDEGWGIYNTNRVWIHVDDVIGYVSFPTKAITNNSYRYTTEEVINFYINKAIQEYNVQSAEHRLLDINIEISEAYGFYLFTGTQPTEEELQELAALLEEQKALTELIKNQ